MNPRILGLLLTDEGVPMLVFQKTLKSLESIKASSDGPGLRNAQSQKNAQTLAQEILATIGLEEGHVQFTTQPKPSQPVEFTVTSGGRAPETGVRLVNGTVMLNNSAALDIAETSKHGVDYARQVEKAGTLLADAILAELRKKGSYGPPSSEEEEKKAWHESPFKEVNVSFGWGEYFAASGAGLEIEHAAFAMDMPKFYENYKSAGEIAKKALAKKGLEVLYIDWGAPSRPDGRSTFVVADKQLLKETVASAAYQEKVRKNGKMRFVKYAVGGLVPFFGWSWLSVFAGTIHRRHAAMKKGHGLVEY